MKKQDKKIFIGLAVAAGAFLLWKNYQAAQTQRLMTQSRQYYPGTNILIPPPVSRAGNLADIVSNFGNLLTTVVNQIKK